MNELVSVIIPVYNAEEFLDEAIESVINQSYSQIEIVIVDDGSTDASAEKCDAWAHVDGRIKVFHTENRGPSIARNFAIEHASGEYILPVDSDDKIAPTYVEKAVKVLDDNPNVGIVYCKASLFGSRTGEWRLPDYSLEEMLISNCVFATAMFRRKDWKKTGGYSVEMRCGNEDYDFWLSVISLGRSVFQIPEILFFYRKRDGSRTCLFESAGTQVMKATNRKKYVLHSELYRTVYRVFGASTKIALYGAGGAGKNYYEFIETLGMSNIVVWVDVNYEIIGDVGLPIQVSSPNNLRCRSYDVIVIAVNNKQVVKEIKQKLVQSGIDEACIYWYLNKNTI